MAEKKHKHLTIIYLSNGIEIISHDSNPREFVAQHPDMSEEDVIELYKSKGYEHENVGGTHHFYLKGVLIEKPINQYGFDTGKQFAQHVKAMKIDDFDVIYQVCLAVAKNQMDGTEVTQVQKDIFWHAVDVYFRTTGFPAPESFIDGFADEMLKEG